MNINSNKKYRDFSINRLKSNGSYKLQYRIKNILIEYEKRCEKSPSENRIL